MPFGFWKTSRILSKFKSRVQRLREKTFSKSDNSPDMDRSIEGIKRLIPEPLKRMRGIGGVVLIVAGVIGLLVPIVPGTALLMAGGALLGSRHPVVVSLKKRLKQGREVLWTRLGDWRKSLRRK